MDIWELTARELIRDTLARYTWAGDAFRLDELAAAFCPDGVLEVRDTPPHEGRDAIVAFLSGVGTRSGVDIGDGERAPADDDARRARRRAAAAASGVRRIVRHNVANIRFLELTPTQALVASYFTVVTEIGLDHCGRYRDTLVPSGGEWLIRHRFVSTDWRSPDSTMAAPAKEP
ncbi:MAG TPA: nuclear transport factor 2 family protein [Acidimicrobiales bacterium]|jgi:hypothetical protein|nr:nuclear transport factor 2 family protein [Acidimicrobiales bacterium]